MNAAQPRIPMRMSGFCQHPSPGSHQHCTTPGCACVCHEWEEMTDGN